MVCSSYMRSFPCDHLWEKLVLFKLCIVNALIYNLTNVLFHYVVWPGSISHITTLTNNGLG